MKRRGRIRRVAKWAGVVACVLIAAAWLVSQRWTCIYWGRSDDCIGINRGAFVLCGDPFWPYPGTWRIEGHAGRAAFWTLEWNRDFDIVIVPLWMPFVLLALPTAWLYWRDCRARPGHCACGYALAGLPAGAPCPECGRRRHNARKDMVA